MTTALVSVRRGGSVATQHGASPVRLVFEESNDEVCWSACGGSDAGGEVVVAAAEMHYAVPVRMRRFRVRPLPVPAGVVIQIDVRVEQVRPEE